MPLLPRQRLLLSCTAMTTPEGKIKRLLRERLKALGVWFWFPSAGPMGKSGIPDVICIANGLFIGIECKADVTKRPTPLQMKVGQQIIAAGGQWHLVRCKNDIDKIEDIIMEAVDVKRRIRYNFSDGFAVALGEDKLELPVQELSEEVMDHLTKMGLRAYLQGHLASVPEDEKLNKVSDAFEELIESGLEALERPSPVGRRVEFRREDKIMALALLKGVPITAMKLALAKYDKEKVNKLLDSEPVMKKLREMDTDIEL
jgi:hypothetical protein